MSCDHVIKFREQNGIVSYEILHAFYVSCIVKDSLKRKAEDCICSQCKTYKRIHACLYCIYFGCYTHNRHIHEHAKENNHELAIDVNYGHVHCFTCGDYQYDAEFEKIAQRHQLIVSLRKGSSLKPNMLEMAVIKKQHKVVNISKIGLRGILNMGNTCYINVILQSLVHAPLFRDYFLTLQHKCSFRKTALESQDVTSELRSQDKNPELPLCFACEISDIVQEFFSGKKAPFVPNRLLHLLWIHEVELNGDIHDIQQDAHEFFLKLLHNLHLNCRESNGNTVSDQLCKCIIDTIFTGFSKYVYTCQKCHNEYSENTSFKYLTLICQTPTTDGTEPVPLLADCLKKSLMSVVPGVSCSVCNQTETFNVHMTLTKLPLVISFHVNQLCKKKKFIGFPEDLDMTPYVFSHNNKEGNKEDSLNKSPDNIFYLFAVVEHIGDASAGHYLCYVRRHKTNWFLCNDSVVTEVSVKDVLSKEAYLLFYHKQILDYALEDITDEMGFLLEKNKFL